MLYCTGDITRSYSGLRGEDANYGLAVSSGGLANTAASNSGKSLTGVPTAAAK